MSSFLTGVWLWAILGVALLVAELLSGTFIFLFFAASAFVVALIHFLFDTGPTLEGILFALLGAAGLLGFRTKLRAALASRGADGKVSVHDENKTLFADSAIAARTEGRLSYQGSTWMAFNESDKDIQTGQQTVIVRTEGVKLIVKPL